MAKNFTIGRLVKSSTKGNKQPLLNLKGDRVKLMKETRELIGVKNNCRLFMRHLILLTYKSMN